MQKMSKFGKQLKLDIYHRLNVHPARLTKKDDLKSFLNKIRPVICDKELIRLGPKGDGGYLVPNDLSDLEACFSPGVDCVSGFEKDCADMGMKVFLADKSVERPPETHELFNFSQKYIGVTTNEDFMTLDDWVASSLPESKKDLLLQIDIEGFEYEVFFNASDKLMNRFRIMVVEFHFLDQLFSRPYFNLVSRVFDKLLQTHTCVHNHPNNATGSIKHKDIEIPLLSELTFLRNDRVTGAKYAETFPHPLDCDNSDDPPLYLPKCWYC